MAPIESSGPKLFNTLDDLGKQLDQSTVPIVKHRPGPNRFRLFHKAYRLDNWARRWRQGWFQPSFETPRRERRARYGPMIMAVAGITWLLLSGAIVAGWLVHHSGENQPISAAPPPEVGRLAVAVNQKGNPAEDIQEVIEDLEVPLQRPRPGRIPSIVGAGRSEPAPAQGQGCLGTRVNFVDTTSEAASLADKNHKLMMLLNISGDFEETRFT